ncbi:MAG: hypothetical protein QXX77_07740 [Candidatus Methanosuratincola sp.]|jgi:hypothetical protein
MKGLYQIAEEIENITTTSKLFINGRDKLSLSTIKNTLDALERKVEAAESLEETLTPQQRLLIGAISGVVARLKNTLLTMEAIKDNDPLYTDLDIPFMVDILLRNIKSLILHINEGAPLDCNRIKEDLKLIEGLEDQHKRILITYLAQNWRNLKEVIPLIKLGENYKLICSQLCEMQALLKEQ